MSNARQAYFSPLDAASAARRCVELIRPSIGPYLSVPPLGPSDVRRLVTDLHSRVKGPTAAALNVLARISSDHIDDMRLSTWPGLLPQLLALVADGVGWNDKYAERRGLTIVAFFQV